MLALVAMPHFDILTNVMILNSIGILSAIFQAIVHSKMRGRKRFVVFSILAIVLLLAGYALFAIGYINEAGQRLSERDTALMIGLAIACTVCVSFNWWENYASWFNILFFKTIAEEVKRTSNIVGILSSITRIAVTGAVLGAYVYLSGQEWESVLSISQKDKVTVLSLFAIQFISSALCRWFAVVACKMHAVRRSFVYPMWFVSPAVLAAFVLCIWIPYLEEHDNIGSIAQLLNHSFPLYCNISVSFYNYSDVLDPFLLKAPAFDLMRADITHSLCRRPSFYDGDLFGQGLLASSVISWWLGLVMGTMYISFSRTKRIQRTRDLFVRSLYEALFIDSSMLLNTRFDVPKLKRDMNIKYVH